MKKLTILPALAFAAAQLWQPTPAEAGDGDAIVAAVGGLITGAVVANILDDDHRTVIVKAGHRGRGHYEWRRVRVWVPGYYKVRYDRCGTRIRIWVPGYYTFERRKVWVPRRDFCPPRYHPGRGHRRGYDRDYGRHVDRRHDWDDDWDDDDRRRVGRRHRG